LRKQPNYTNARGSRKEEAMFDQDMGVKYWLHPAVKVTILQDNEDNSTTQIFTDGRTGGRRWHSRIQIRHPH
jgi:hypothetical protein